MNYCEEKVFKGAHKENCPFNLSLVKQVVRVPYGTKLTKEQLADDAQIRTLVQEGKLIKSSEFENATDNSSGDQFGENGYGTSKRTSKSNLSVQFDFNDAWCNLQTMKNSWDGVEGYVYFIDMEDRLFGHFNDSGELEPVSARLYSNYKFFKISNDIDYSGNLVVTLSPENRDDINGFVVASAVADVDGVREMKAEFSNISATGFDVKLTSGCDGLEVTGLTDVNFELSDAVAISGVTDNGNGNYTFTTDADPAGKELSTVEVVDLDPLFVNLEPTTVQ